MHTYTSLLHLQNIHPRKSTLFLYTYFDITYKPVCILKGGFQKASQRLSVWDEGRRPFTFYSEYAELNKNIRIKDGFGVLFLCLAIPTSFCFKFVLVLIDVLPFFVTHKLKVTESCLIISPWNVFFPQHIGLFDSTRSERRDCEGTVCRL